MTPERIVVGASVVAVAAMLAAGRTAAWRYVSAGYALLAVLLTLRAPTGAVAAIGVLAAAALSSYVFALGGSGWLNIALAGTFGIAQHLIVGTFAAFAIRDAVSARLCPSHDARVRSLLCTTPALAVLGLVAMQLGATPAAGFTLIAVAAAVFTCAIAARSRLASWIDRLVAGTETGWRLVPGPPLPGTALVPIRLHPIAGRVPASAVIVDAAGRPVALAAPFQADLPLAGFAPARRADTMTRGITFAAVAVVLVVCGGTLAFAAWFAWLLGHMGSAH